MACHISTCISGRRLASRTDYEPDRPTTTTSFSAAFSLGFASGRLGSWVSLPAGYTATARIGISVLSLLLLLPRQFSASGTDHVIVTASSGLWAFAPSSIIYHGMAGLGAGHLAVPAKRAGPRHTAGLPPLTPSHLLHLSRLFLIFYTHLVGSFGLKTRGTQQCTRLGTARDRRFL